MLHTFREIDDPSNGQQLTTSNVTHNPIGATVNIAMSSSSAQQQTSNIPTNE